MTTAQLKKRAKEMRKVWLTLTPEQQGKWRQLHDDIECAIFVVGLMQYEPEPLQKMQQLTLEDK